MTPQAQIAKHIRQRLSHEGIAARVLASTSCGTATVTIVPPTADGRFSDDEQRTVRIIAQGSRLTRVRGVAIDLERMTDPAGATFYLPKP